MSRKKIYKYLKEPPEDYFLHEPIMAYYCFISKVWVHITPMEMKPNYQRIEIEDGTKYIYEDICDEYNHFGMFFSKDNPYLYVLYFKE